jgi:uncharacterized membrane protein (DUF4010 family)
MKNTKYEQIIWLYIATAFTAGMIFFVVDNTVVLALSTTFTAIVGTFLGIDIALMIKKTQNLPRGQYKKINKHRYIISLIIFSLLMLEAFFINSYFGRNCDSLYGTFGMGFLIVIGGLIAGVEGNKIVTDNHKKLINPLEKPQETCAGASEES